MIYIQKARLKEVALARTHTEETKAKIRAAALARPDKEEHMANLTLAATVAKKGSKHSEATLAKFKLRRFTDEQRAKISAAAKAREAKAREARECRAMKNMGGENCNISSLAETTACSGVNRIPVLVRKIKTGEITAYSSLSAAGKGIGVSKDTPPFFGLRPMKVTFSRYIHIFYIYVYIPKTIKKYLESGDLFRETFTFTSCARAPHKKKIN